MKKRLLGFLIIFLFIINFASAVWVFDGNATSPSFAAGLSAALENNVNVPSSLEWISKFIFGLRDKEGIKISEFIIYLVVFLCFLFILYEFIHSFFDKNKVYPFILALVVNLLISSSGGMREAAGFFFDLGHFASFLKYGILQLIFAVIIVVAVLFGFLSLKKYIVYNTKLDAERQKGAIEVMSKVSR